MIAGTNSGSGKTTLTLGLLRLMTRKGLNVRPFKCGPDYIDGLFHRQAAGIDSINLDAYFSSHKYLLEYVQGMDAAVVEGVMGLFDGIKPGGIEGSCAEVAAKLDLPVILTVNAKGLSDSIAPMVKGFADWNPRVKIVGVIANNVGSERHGEILRQVLKTAGLPPLIGYLRRDERWILPERHLGLSLGKLPEGFLDSLADELEKTLDLELLLSLTSAERPELSPQPLPEIKYYLGVAYDEAFCFYYQQNFDLLRRFGVEIVFFSPLHDRELPENLNGIYLGGGYPELYAKELSENVSMLSAIRQFAETHLVYGECGGYLYLLEGLTDFEGNFHPLLDLLPGRAKMNRKLSALGYREVRGDWGTVRGHEFHYSSLCDEPETPNLWESCDVRGNSQRCGSVRGNVKGSYIHLHFASSENALKAFMKELSK